MIEISNAIIKSADVSTLDTHAPILTASFGGTGWGIGYPGYSGNLAKHVGGLLGVAGANTLSGCVGKPVRVVMMNSVFKSVMHFTDDRIVLDPREITSDD